MSRHQGFLIFIVAIMSCSNYQLPGYRFSNFKDTPAWELAQAVNDDNSSHVSSLLASNSSLVDYKDPEYELNLLILSIVNNKKEAFIALLKSGANPNGVYGVLNDESPLLTAIDFAENCELFFIENLINYGAVINTPIIYNENGNVKKKLPLFSAINKTDNDGEDCMNIISLLDRKGVDLNMCINNSPDPENCESVYEATLKRRQLETLRYFVIEMKHPVPDSIYYNSGTEGYSKYSSLYDILTGEDNYLYEESTRAKEAKRDLIQFLKLQSKNK